MAIWRRRDRADRVGADADEAVEQADPTDPTDPDDGAAVLTDEPQDEPQDEADVEADVEADIEADIEPEDEPEDDVLVASEPADADPDPDPAANPAADPADPAEAAATSRLRLSVRDATPATLTLAAHPRQALATAVGVTIGSVALGRPARESVVVFLTVLVGQAILGWHNDLVDRFRDRDHDATRKPIADGRLDPGTAWYALTIAVLLLIPLSISTGITAGAFYLVSVVVGIVGNVVLRTGLFSWVTWAVSFALLPFYLTHGGWGGSADGGSPEPAMVVLTALLGIGVHVLVSIWGMVDDDDDGWVSLPLRLGRRLGATRLLVLSSTYLGAVLLVIVVLGSTIGLRA